MYHCIRAPKHHWIQQLCRYCLLIWNKTLLQRLIDLGRKDGKKVRIPESCGADLMFLGTEVKAGADIHWKYHKTKALQKVYKVIIEKLQGKKKNLYAAHFTDIKAGASFTLSFCWSSHHLYHSGLLNSADKGSQNLQKDTVWILLFWVRKCLLQVRGNWNSWNPISCIVSLGSWGI